MKRLLDLPVLDVFKTLATLPVPEPITTQQGLHYLMFMQAISEELMCQHNDPNAISLEYIEELAKEHGGFVPQDWLKLSGQAAVTAMLHNSTQGVFFTRLTYLTAKLLED